MSSPALVRGVRLVLGALALPHELAHAAAMRPWTADVRIDLDPARDERFAGRGIDRPVARFDAAIRPGTPPWAVRLCAGAPLPAFLGLAGALDAAVGLAGTTPVTLLATAAVAYWASLSDGDVAILLDPSAVIGAGTFAATGRSRAAGLAPLLLTPAVTAVVGLAFLT